MSTPISSTTTSALAPLWRVFAHQVQAETLRLWRTPSFLAPTLILPLILYTLLGGLGKGHTLEDGVSRQVYALASVGTYCIVSVMLYSFGVNIANERGQRVNVLMRATPLPASIYLLAKVATALASALVMLLVLSLFASLIGGVQLSASAWVTLVASLLLGVLPFIMLGFALGNMVNPTGATAVINLSFFILAFASGIFVPLAQLPDVLQNVAPYSPFYRLGQLAWNAVGVPTDPLAYRREERRAFG